jgi:hypothetical protein
LSRAIRGGPAYWLCGFRFGAIAPTLVAWFVVAPLRGLPVANGFVPGSMIVGPLVNGAFGFGTLMLAYLLGVVRR